jgi:hypothetical protein
VKQGFAWEIVQVLADVDPHAVVAAVANHPGKETIRGLLLCQYTKHIVI